MRIQSWGRIKKDNPAGTDGIISSENEEHVKDLYDSPAGPATKLPNKAQTGVTTVVSY